MPVAPKYGSLHIVLDGPDSVARLVETARGIDAARAARFGTAASRLSSDLGDHLCLLSALAPEWFAPYREEAVVELHDRLPMRVDVAAVLLNGASDTAVRSVVDRLRSDPASWSDLVLLAAIGTDRALSEFAAHVRRHPDVAQWANRLGVHIPDSGSARLRFTPDRFAFLASDETRDGTVGLDVGAVSIDPLVTWQYLSFRPAIVSGLPDWPHALLHIVAPRTYWYTLHACVDAGGRLQGVVFDDDGEPFDAHLRDIEAAPPSPSGLTLRRYDADLVYGNGHIQSTPGVLGTAGGAPVGIYANPTCPDCGVLMFHAATIESWVRDYGDGFRSVYFCEACERVAVTGTNWN